MELWHQPASLSHWPLYFLQTIFWPISSPKRGAHIFRKELQKQTVMGVKIFSAFRQLPDSYPNGYRGWEEENGGDDEEGNDFAFLLPPLPPQLNLHHFHPSLPSHTEIFISISLHLSMGKVEDEKDPICWQITDWLNIYKMDYWLFHFAWDERNQGKGEKCGFRISVKYFSTFFAEQMTEGQIEGD